MTKYDMLTTDQLYREAERLTDIQNRAHIWTRVNTEIGKMVTDELEAELAGIRSMYAEIDSTSDKAAYILAGYQGREATIRSIINRIKKSDWFKKDIDSEVKKILNVIQKRQMAHREVGQPFVSSLAQEETNGHREQGRY